MKNRIMICGALLLTLGVSSCHRDADVLLNYAYNDEMAFHQAEESYAGKFRVFWNAMNQNYTLWDYEEQNGLDWNAVYDKFLPKFEALDEPGVVVSDSLLEALMKELIAPLHDGHMLVEFINHQTKNTIYVSPSSLRAEQRQDVAELKNFHATMASYEQKKALKRWMYYDATVAAQAARMMMGRGIGHQWVKSRLAELKGKDSLTEEEVIQYDGLLKLDRQLDALVGARVSKSWLSAFNDIVTQYSYLDVPFMEPIDTRFVDCGMRIEFAQTNDDIVYLHISNFSLTVYLEDNTFEQELGGGTARNREIRQNIVQVWQSWFDTIQDLHKSGRLKGVIIDMRDNNGGYMNDARYVLGALLPQGGLQYGWSRFKRGTGRYDFSPFMPKVMYTMDSTHEVIDDKPIVVLANAKSVSMAEMTSLSVQQLKNGTLVGRKTHGGLCGLVPNNYNSENYSGHIGVSGETPVYVYLPTECIFNIDKKCLEGIGVTPDIEVPYDEALYESTGADSQIDRALQFIRTGL